MLHFFMEITQSLPELNGINKGYMQYITAADKNRFCRYKYSQFKQH